MGSGARVSKDVSEITLVHDTFEIMPGILEEGQVIIQNVKDMAKLFLFKNSFSVILIFVTQYLSLNFPFNPQHVTLFNFIIITIPSTWIILFAKKGSDMGAGYMKEIMKYSVTAGLFTAMAAFTAGVYALLVLRGGEALYHTFIVSAICVMGVFNYVYIYRWPKKVRDLLETKALATAAICMAVFPGAMYLFDRVSDFFSITGLSWNNWLVILAMSAAGIIFTYLSLKLDLLSKIFTPSANKE